MSIRVYTGEFLVSPVPLHLDMNYCSHQCFYCFANLNSPQRRLDASFLRPMLKALSRDADQSEPPVYWLARRGYPVLASNTADPFAKSNTEQFKMIYETLSELGVRFTYQTKGGDSEAIAMALDGPPTMWYVSLTTDNDALGKSMEPGAMRHKERLELMARAVVRGNHVVAGINPLVPDWWDDTDKLIEDLLEIGVNHAWVQPLHFSRFQVASMSEKARRKYAPVIEYGMKKVKPDTLTIAAWCRDAESAGIRIYGDADSHFQFWDPYFQLGFPHWPTLTGWFNHLMQVGGGQPVMFGIDDLADWCDVGLPAGKSWYKDFVQPIGRSIRNLMNRGEAWRKVHESPKSIRDVITSYWQIFDYPTRLRSPYIAVAVEQEPEGMVLLEDGDGQLLYVFVPSGHEPEAFDVSAQVTLRYWELCGMR